MRVLGNAIIPNLRWAVGSCISAVLYNVESISHHFMDGLFFMTTYRLSRPLGLEWVCIWKTTSGNTKVIESRGIFEILEKHSDEKPQLLILVNVQPGHELPVEPRLGAARPR